jgi:SPP1 family predicted phage head-tail adaptor
MPISAGDLKDRVTIERATITRDTMNAAVEAWTAIGTRWAQVSYGRGDERRQAAQESASVAATFRLRRDTLARTITVKDRLSFAGGAWDIASIVPFERDGLDFTAVRKAD